jgi:hypothetical protein
VKRTLKHILGELPLAPEVYWQVRGRGQPLSRAFSLKRVSAGLPIWRAEAAAARQNAPAGKRLALFATLRYWIEHAALLGISLAGLGHTVELGFLPYANYQRPFNRFDLRRQNAYSLAVLGGAGDLLRPVSLLDVRPPDRLPDEVRRAVLAIALRDAQYSLQVESVPPEHPLLALRRTRDLSAAAAAYAWLTASRPDTLIVPNGSILEMGAVYTVARHLEIPVVSYEFGEQTGRIWTAHNREVMRQETDELWAARRAQPLTPAQDEQIRALFAARQGGQLWENFSRRWQGQANQGAEAARAQLGLDARPIVLLAANVIGDSLTLGRQVFTESMTAWLERTVQDFAKRPQAQLVLRIHPGERFTGGPSVAEVVNHALPGLARGEYPHIHLVGATAPTNTYDLAALADLGLVYTTTVGLELAMSGAPVIVVGRTHYRDRGFTLDPTSWDDYTAALDGVLADPAAARLTAAQVEAAWNYAYRFFFEYPQPFPWHLLHFWEELETWPVGRVLAPEGQAAFGETFASLSGAPRRWQPESV